MLIIRCSKCKNKLFKYEKIGKGNLLHLWKKRIKKEYSIIKSNKNIYCECGNLIGVDEGIYIKLKKSSITYSGEIIK